MSNPTKHIEIITSVQRRRRWTASEKVRMVEETFEPGMTVSLVARRRSVAPNQLFTWRRLVAQGSLTAAGSGEEVVPASDYRALQNQVRELHRLLGKKTLEAEILKEALEHATGQKNNCGCRRRRRRTVRDEDRGRGHRRLPLQSCAPSTGTVQEADRSAPASGRRTGVQDRGGHRRAADLRLSAGPRRSQASGAGCRSKTAQSQANLPGYEGSWPAARSPRWRGRAAP